MDLGFIIPVVKPRTIALVVPCLSALLGGGCATSLRQAVGENPIAEVRPVSVMITTPKREIVGTIDSVAGVASQGGLIGALIGAAVDAGQRESVRKTLTEVGEKSAPLVWDEVETRLAERLIADEVTGWQPIFRLTSDRKGAISSMVSSNPERPLLAIEPNVWLSPDMSRLYVGLVVEGYVAGSTQQRWYINHVRSTVPSFLNIYFLPDKKYTAEAQEAFETALRFAAKEAVELLCYDLTQPHPPPDAASGADSAGIVVVRRAEGRIWQRHSHGVLEGVSDDEGTP